MLEYAWEFQTRSPEKAEEADEASIGSDPTHVDANHTNARDTAACTAGGDGSVDVTDITANDISLIRTVDIDASSIPVAHDADTLGTEDETAAREMLQKHKIAQGSAARSAALLRPELAAHRSTQVPAAGRGVVPASAGLLGVAKTRAIHWSHLDSIVEASLLRDVPVENLQAVAKPQRSEKATMLLYGYINESDKKALKQQAAPQSSASSSALSTARDHMDNSALLDEAGAEEDSAVVLGMQAEPNPLQHFLDCEDVQERRRFVGERWLDKVVLVESLQCFTKICDDIAKARSIADSVTVRIRCRMLRWLKTARRALYTNAVMREAAPDVYSHPFRPPPIALLKQTHPMLLDWPNKALENLLANAQRVAFRAGEAVYFEGERGQDAFLLCTGEVRGVVMTNRRRSKAVFTAEYRRRKEGIAATEQDSRQSHEASKKHRPSGDGATVVSYVLKGQLFGLDSVVLGGEPRLYSAWCHTNCTLLRLSRDAIVLAMSSLADLSFRIMQDAVWRERHQLLYGCAWPIPQDILAVAAPAFALWHTSALQDLWPKCAIEVRRKGETLCVESTLPRVGSATLCVILRGSVRASTRASSLTGAPSPILKPCTVIGEESVVLAGHIPRFTATCLETTDVLVVTQDDYLSVARQHGDCGVYARQAISRRLAEGVVKPSACPAAVLRDPVLSFLFPEALLRRLWSEPDFVEPVFILQGDSVFRTWDEARYVYLFTSGTMFQQFDSNGPQVPVVTLADMLHGAVRDDEVQHAQHDGMEEDDMLYRAIASPGAFMKNLRKEMSQQPPQPAKHGAAVAGVQRTEQQRHVWVPLERNLIVEEDALSGIVVGAVELATHRASHLSHLRATSNVSGWRCDRHRIERHVRTEHPNLWAAMRLPEVAECVLKHFKNMTLRQLADEPAPRNAE